MISKRILEPFLSCRVTRSRSVPPFLSCLRKPPLKPFKYYLCISDRGGWDTGPPTSQRLHAKPFFSSKAVDQCCPPSPLDALVERKPRLTRAHHEARFWTSPHYAPQLAFGPGRRDVVKPLRLKFLAVVELASCGTRGRLKRPITQCASTYLSKETA